MSRPSTYSIDPAAAGNCHFCGRSTRRIFRPEGHPYHICHDCSTSVWSLLKHGFPPQDPAVIKPTRQYYHMEPFCGAKNNECPSCICWYDEGTGPLPTAMEVMNSHLEWRDKPGKDITDKVFGYSPEEPPADPVSQLVEELQAVVHRARLESDLSLATYIGALEMMKMSLFQDEVVAND
jgi:hypothetical protein